MTSHVTMVTQEFHALGCYIPSPLSYNTVHVISCLRKSTDFRGNPSRISVKVCVEICGLPWKSVWKFADRLWQARGIVFRDSADMSFRRPRIRLVGVLQTIFGRPQVIESVKSSSGVSEIVLWNHKSCVNRCAISFEPSTATLQRIIPQVRTEVLRIPSNVSTYSLRWFCGRFTEVRKLPHRSSWNSAKLPCGISRKTYAANPQNSVTNLWHVP